MHLQVQVLLLSPVLVMLLLLLTLATITRAVLSSLMILLGLLFSFNFTTEEIKNEMGYLIFIFKEIINNLVIAIRL